MERNCYSSEMLRLSAHGALTCTYNSGAWESLPLPSAPRHLPLGLSLELNRPSNMEESKVLGFPLRNDSRTLTQHRILCLQSKTSSHPPLASPDLLHTPLGHASFSVCLLHDPSELSDFVFPFQHTHAHTHLQHGITLSQWQAMVLNFK